MSTASTQILFIDARIQNIQGILANVGADIDVVMLNSEEAGLDQIAGELENRDGVEAIHIVSHGGSGYLTLGSGQLNEVTLPQYSSSIERIKSVLTDDADILLYGCDVAAGDAGMSFIQLLARLTGADVGASVDRTDSIANNGNWNLEASTGSAALYTLPMSPVCASNQRMSCCVTARKDIVMS